MPALPPVRLSVACPRPFTPVYRPPHPRWMLRLRSSATGSRHVPPTPVLAQHPLPVPRGRRPPLDKDRVLPSRPVARGLRRQPTRRRPLPRPVVRPQRPLSAPLVPRLPGNSDSFGGRAEGAEPSDLGQRDRSETGSTLPACPPGGPVSDSTLTTNLSSHPSPQSAPAPAITQRSAPHPPRFFPSGAEPVLRWERRCRSPGAQRPGRSATRDECRDHTGPHPYSTRRM